MYYQAVSGPQKGKQQLEGVQTIIWIIINSFTILLNFTVQFYLHETMILLASQGEVQFLVLHGIHIFFTIYNLVFTVSNWYYSSYVEGFMSLVSFFITSYSIASVLVMTYWVLFIESEAQGQAFAVVFITMYIVFPGIQSFTYRMLRRARNSENHKMIPVYLDPETAQKLQAQNAQLMI